MYLSFSLSACPPPPPLPHTSPCGPITLAANPPHLRLPPLPPNPAPLPFTTTPAATAPPPHHTPHPATPPCSDRTLVISVPSLSDLAARTLPDLANPVVVRLRCGACAGCLLVLWSRSAQPQQSWPHRHDVCFDKRGSWARCDRLLGLRWRGCVRPPCQARAAAPHVPSKHGCQLRAEGEGLPLQSPATACPLCPTARLPSALACLSPLPARLQQPHRSLHVPFQRDAR